MKLSTVMLLLPAVFAMSASTQRPNGTVKGTPTESSGTVIPQPASFWHTRAQPRSHRHRQMATEAATRITQAAWYLGNGSSVSPTGSRWARKYS